MGKLRAARILDTRLHPAFLRPPGIQSRGYMQILTKMTPGYILIPLLLSQADILWKRQITVEASLVVPGAGRSPYELLVQNRPSILYMQFKFLQPSTKSPVDGGKRPGEALKEGGNGGDLYKKSQQVRRGAWRGQSL